jgi:uncharacterized protein (TIGR00255 family)
MAWVVDPQRLAQEIAVLADRLDVSEEIDRFDRTSPRSVPRSPTRMGSPSGKRLGFVLQEMLREVNTTGSKANDAAMLHDVVLLKEELGARARAGENLE